MDDLGTGHAYLFDLKHLPLEQLKIGQTFMRDIVTDPDDAIIGMVRNQGLDVIAEGVKTVTRK